MPLLQLDDLKKVYRTPDGAIQPVLEVPSFVVDADEQVAIAGTSGSGKTTFLNVIAGILRPDAGRVLFTDEVRGGWVDIAVLSEGDRDAFRASNLGYVFQTFNLLEGYSALENVLLGMMFGRGVDREFAHSLLVDLGLGDRVDYRPSQLSIGQQQRVALARALANRPRLVLADEPTGNLDPRYAQEALEMIRTLCREHGAALLLVSHDQGVLAQFERVVRFTELNLAGGGLA